MADLAEYMQRGGEEVVEEVEEEVVEEEEDPDEALRAKAQEAHLAQAWRLAKLGCWDSAQTRLGVWDGTLLEVATDDELASDGSEDAPSDDSSDVSTEGSADGGAPSSDEADSEEDEAVAPSWRAEGSENSPPKVLAAQQALFAAVGEALSGEVERGGDVEEAVEEFQTFAATALERSPLNLAKPRGLLQPPRPSWPDSESGALLLTPRGAGSEAARFFAGASATEPEAATDDESETLISGGSDGESDAVVRTSGGNTFITDQRLERSAAPGEAPGRAAAAPVLAPAAAAAAAAAAAT